MKLTCDACGKSYEYPANQRHYASRDLGFICSKECILNVLRDRERFPREVNDLRVTQPQLPDREPGHWSRNLQIEFASKYERHVAEWLWEIGEKFRFEPFSIIIGERVPYTPDFWFPQYDAFIEVKGPWAPGAKSKIRKLQKQYPRLLVVPVLWLIHHEFYPNGRNGNG